MGGIAEGTAPVGAEAEAEVPIGIAVMMTSALMEVVGTVEGMMRGITTTRVVAGGAGPLALAIVKVEAGAQGTEGTGVLLGKEVKRDVPKLNSGTGKGNRQNKLIRTIQMFPTTTMKSMTMGSCHKEMITTVTSSSGNTEDMNIDPVSILTSLFIVMFWYLFNEEFHF